jgi:hypothetical protein
MDLMLAGRTPAQRMGAIDGCWLIRQAKAGLFTRVK